MYRACSVLLNDTDLGATPSLALRSLPSSPPSQGLKDVSLVGKFGSVLLSLSRVSGMICTLLPPVPASSASTRRGSGEKEGTDFSCSVLPAHSCQSAGDPFRAIYFWLQVCYLEAISTAVQTPQNRLPAALGYLLSPAAFFSSGIIYNRKTPNCLEGMHSPPHLHLPAHFSKSFGLHPSPLSY